MYRAALFTITKRWNEDKDSVTDEWIKKIHTYMYYVYQLWPLWYISQLVVTPWTTAHQASLSSPSPGTCSNSRPLSWWCHPTLSSSVVPFSCLQSFPASGSFQWVSSSNRVAKVLEFQPHHQSFQWTPRADLLQNGLVGSPCSPKDFQESSPTPQFKSINSLVLSLLHSPTLTSIYDYWKNHSLD